MIIADIHTQQKLGSLATSGFGYIWISQNIGNINMLISEFKIRLKDSLQQDWHNALSNSSKTQYYMYMYMQFKSLLNVERYLTIDIPFYQESICKISVLES